MKKLLYAMLAMLIICGHCEVMMGLIKNPMIALKALETDKDSDSKYLTRFFKKVNESGKEGKGKEVNLQKFSYNNQSYKNVEVDKLLRCIAFVEGYRNTAYFCGSKWTIGYGTTIYPNGRPVREGDRITEEFAVKCVKAHLKQSVNPFIKKYVKRDLTEGEIIATSMFIYNIGGKNFANSEFLRALNENKSAQICAEKMAQYRYAAGKFNRGLLKRRWLEGAIFCGFITPKDISEMPLGGYFMNSQSILYNKYKDTYQFDYSENAISSFIEKNKRRNRKNA